MQYLNGFNITISLPDSKATFEDVQLSSASYSTNGLDLNVDIDDKCIGLRISSTSNQELQINSIEYRFVLPLMNFSKIIVPDCGRFYDRSMLPLLSWGAKYPLSNGNNGNPFIAFLDQDERVVSALGLIGDFIETVFEFDSPGLTRKKSLYVYEGNVVLRITRPVDGFRLGRFPCYTEALFYSESDPTWFHALRSYAGSYYKKHPPDYVVNGKALLPTWCTWVPWNSDSLNEQKVLENARLAHDLGIGTIIIDDGWYGPGLDSDQWDSTMGDNRPAPEKFPDIRALVDKLHAMQLNAMIWHAPLSVSGKADCFPQVKDYLMWDAHGLWKSHNNFHNLCPANPEARNFICTTVERLLDYGFDGLKLDLFNTMTAEPCTAQHEHDCNSNIAAVIKLMRQMWQTARRRKADVLIELKNNYGNLEAAQYGTSVRGGDSPFDSVNNFWNCIYPRAYAPVVHNDYLTWTTREPPRALAVLLIKQLVAGVPTISVDLTKLNQEHQKIVKAWLGFYIEHMELLCHGTIEPQSAAMDVWQIADENKAIIFAINHAREKTKARS